MGRTCGTPAESFRRVLKKAVQQGRSEQEARRTLRYVEPLRDARTPLAGFFSILLGVSRFEYHIECAAFSHYAK